MFSKGLLESDVGGSRCGEHFLSTCSLNAKFDSPCYQNRNQRESKTKLPLSCRNFTGLVGSQRLPVQLKSTSSSNSLPIRGGAMIVSMLASAACLSSLYRLGNNFRITTRVPWQQDRKQLLPGSNDSRTRNASYQGPTQWVKNYQTEDKSLNHLLLIQFKIVYGRVTSIEQNYV